MSKFSHLHVHTQFSLLDGAADIGRLFKKASEDNMPALAITDHGNMFGVFKFVAEAGKHNVKPIVGCEFYVVEDRHEKKFTKEQRDIRYHQLLIAKDAEGYRNLTKLCSLGYIEGLYSKWPRIDKSLILQYHKGLIATTCCIGASVPQTIIKKGEEAAEKEFKWWLDIFGEDYYIELQRHVVEESKDPKQRELKLLQDQVNETLLRFAEKYQVKVICTNDSHYVDQQDANAHDILLCVNTGDKQSTPIASDEEGGKGFRFGFPNDQFYFKTTAEMSQLFADVPQAIDNTNEIVAKVAHLQLKRDILLPNFPIPPEFKIHPDDTLNQWEYLRHITLLGAKKRYQNIDSEIEERINFELHTIKTMGFAGYFLIVADFIKAGRDLGVFVGPGRGSAAGSVVAYCVGITNIDPIKYNLLFERFLNPDRKSMPDIDTDFDDEGRQKVIDYVVDKYGKNQVAQIVTYGTMAAKSSINDVARVMDLPLQEARALSNLVPTLPSISLQRVLKAPIDGEKSLKEKEGLRPEDIEKVKKLREIYLGHTTEAKVLKEALLLEGSVRNVGVHAAGIIIAPEDLTSIIPVATSKDSDLLVTQFEGKVIEDAGVIKMDFLGLKTLSIIKNALNLIKKNHNVEIAIDEIPLDDKATFELYQKGGTNATFQFESSGMQKYLRDLIPDKFEDLIAMNALYRPGPLEYIPKFIRRKLGQEPVEYDLPEMEEYLQETYGVTVYQEQVMLLSQKLAGFTKGDADVLRKAMGKKDRATLDKLKPKFIEQSVARGLPEPQLNKIWTDWEAFAQYAFNKSHSTCYAFVAYQTAYLKAHYPSEYMAAVLNNAGDITKITFFMDECKQMGVPVLGPDVNESEYTFTVNKKGEIRFGLGGIKGLGERCAESIIQERTANGVYATLYDFARRSSWKHVNKKSYEVLAYSGALDTFGFSRSQYFELGTNVTMSGVERLVRYCYAHQKERDDFQQSLFGGGVDQTAMEPTLPEVEEWGLIEKLKYEKEVIGIYLTGHPLDDYRVELDNFCNLQVSHIKWLEQLKQGTPSAEDVEELKKIQGRELQLGALVSKVQERISKSGKPFAIIEIEDYTDTAEFALFGEDYIKFKQYLEVGYFVYIQGTMQKRYQQEGTLELKITQMSLLADVREKKAKQLTLHLALHDIRHNIIETLCQILEQDSTIYPNKTCQVKILVYYQDEKEKMNIEMRSKTTRIYLSNELLQELQKLNISYRLN